MVIGILLQSLSKRISDLSVPMSCHLIYLTVNSIFCPSSKRDSGLYRFHAANMLPLAFCLMFQSGPPHHHRPSWLHLPYITVAKLKVYFSWFALVIELRFLKSDRRLHRTQLFMIQLLTGSLSLWLLFRSAQLSGCNNTRRFLDFFSSSSAD